MYYYNDYIKDINRFKYEYKSKLRCITIGHSHDNRDIFLLKFGKGEKKILITSGVHGRESINIKALMLTIENLINDMSYILEKFTFYIIPLLNPDGYMIALKGFNIINNIKLKDICNDRNIKFSEWKYNARAVDINRNFPSKLWKKKDIYDFPASENETKALIRIFKKYKTDAYFDIHSRGKEIYYYRNVMDSNYNDYQLYIANMLSIAMKYKLVKPINEINENDSGGNTVHFYSEICKKPALTIETINDIEDFPLNMNLLEETYNELLEFIKALEFIF